MKVNLIGVYGYEEGEIMLIGCCAPFEQAKLLSNLNYDTITLAASEVVTWSPEHVGTVKKILDTYGLRCNSLNSFCERSLCLTGAGVSKERIREYANKLAVPASQLGISYIGIGAPASRNVNELGEWGTAMEQFRGAMEEICEIFKKYGIEVLLESVCNRECNLITTVKEAFTFVQDAGLPNLHLVYDIYHEQVMNQPIQIIEEAAEEIRVVHIAEDCAESRYYLSRKCEQEYRKYWNALKKIGFQGEFTVEAFAGETAKGIEESRRVIRLIEKG